MASGLLIAGASGTPPIDTSPSDTANLWIDPNGGACIRHFPPASYEDAQACGSLQAAYTAARPGDVVDILDGTYTSQALAADSKPVTFRAAGPGRPSFGQIVSAASNITVRGILIENRAGFDGPCEDPDNAILYPCGANETFDDVVIDGLNAPGGFENGGKHGIRAPGKGFVLENSEIRNIVDQKGFEGGSDGMVIDHNYWHDIRVRTETVHNECMYVDGGNGAVISRNIFIGCPTMALFFTNWNGGPPYSNVLVENNVFGHTLDTSGAFHPGCTFVLGGGANNQNVRYGWIIRYNTFETCAAISETPAAGDKGAGQFYGNLGGHGDCGVPEFVYSYNVGDTCGGKAEVFVNHALNSRVSPNQAPFYVNAQAGDFHLVAGAAAINRGDPAHFPATDRDGRRRPTGSTPDVGAYEYGARRPGRATPIP